MVLIRSHFKWTDKLGEMIDLAITEKFQQLLCNSEQLEHCLSIVFHMIFLFRHSLDQYKCPHLSVHCISLNILICLLMY